VKIMEVPPERERGPAIRRALSGFDRGDRAIGTASVRRAWAGSCTGWRCPARRPPG